jgi:hypothetical protein
MCSTPKLSRVGVTSGGALPFEIKMTREGDGMKTFLIPRVLSLAMLVLVTASTGVLFSQNVNNGEIRGVVTDPSGAVVPGVEVTFTNVLTGVRVGTTTNASGLYDDPALVFGTYSITFSKSGFKTFIRGGITLGLQVIKLNVTLSVGAVSQQVTVAGATPLLETATSEGSASLSAEEGVNLPNVGQQWYTFAELAPGIAPGPLLGDYLGGTEASVNGSAPFTSNWVINGSNATEMDGNNNPNGESNVPFDDIAEIKVNTNNFSAQYGNGSSVISLNTKTGTNQWHGSLFEYFGNTALNARNFFEAQTSPLNYNQFGGTVGGPIKHDKAFFFFSYQDGRDLSYAPTLSTVPTAAEEAGDFSGSAYPTVYNPASLVDGARTPLPNNTIPASDISPFAAAAQKYFPQPNLPGLFNNYFADLDFPLVNAWYNFSVEYHFSPSNQLLIQGGVNQANQPQPSAFPTQSFTLHDRNQQYSISDSWSISPTKVNNLHLSVVRGVYVCQSAEPGPFSLGELNPFSDLFPNLTISGAISTFLGGGTGCTEGETDGGPSDVLTIIKGKHMLNLGGEYDRLDNNDSGWPITTTGNFDFSGTMTEDPANPTSAGLGYADFLYGLPQSWSIGNTPVFGSRSWEGAMFIQDDYQVRKDLTLNLGFRYGIQGGWSEEANRISDFDPSLINPTTNTPGALWYAGQDGRTLLDATEYHGFQPRVGFAWSPRGNSNWAVRGGYGIFDEPRDGAAYGGVNVGELGQGWDTTGSEISDDLYTPIFSMSPPTATLLADYPTLTQGPASDLVVYPSAKTRTASLLNGESIGYVPYNALLPYIQQAHFDIQHQLPNGIFVDVGYVWTRGIHLPWGANYDQVPENRLGPGNAELREPYPQYTGISGYMFDGVSNYNALQITAKRKFANGLMFAANYTWSKAEDTETVSEYDGGDAFLVQNSYNTMADYGLGNMDMAQIFNFEAVYQLPVGSGRQFVNRGGILNGVIGGWQLSGILWLHSGSPFTPIMGTANLSGSLQNDWYPNRLASGTLPNPSISEWFNTAAFVEPAPYTFGNSGRDVLLGPSYKDLDVSLSKSFPIRKLGESARFQIRADATDFFNNPNFGEPNASIGTLAAGAISTANTSRALQLGAHLTF